MAPLLETMVEDEERQREVEEDVDDIKQEKVDGNRFGHDASKIDTIEVVVG